METTLSTSLNQNSDQLAITSLSNRNSNSIFADSGHILGNTLIGHSSSQVSDSDTFGGNIIVGNGKWVITGFDQQLFTSLADNTVDNFVSIAFDRLNDKYVSEGGEKITNSVTNENPFADGKNPFGDGNMPELPLLDFFKSRFGENFPMPSSQASNLSQESLPIGVNNMSIDGDFSVGDSSNNVFTGDIISDITTTDSSNLNTDNITTTDSSNLNTDNITTTDSSNLNTDNITTTDSSNLNTDNITTTDSNNLNTDNITTTDNSSSITDNNANTINSVDNNNPVTGDNRSTIANIDNSNPITGNYNYSFPDSSMKETLSRTLDFVSNLKGRFDTISVDSTFGEFGGNSPFKTPSELLRLFRSDMTAFGLTVESFTDFVGEDNPFAGTSNPFAGSDGDNTSASQDDRLFKFLGWALDGLLPVTGTPNVFQTPEGELPLGYGNRDFGNGNATIGNANRNYGDNNSSIGNNNWNWDSSTSNVTIGNGNWNWNGANSNKTVGNGNWHLDNSSDNNTFGNGNWNIGSQNSTLGNGNFNFGSNNLIIGNGNWVFTNNSIVIGNGNWSVVMENTPANVDNVSSLLEKIDNFAVGAEIKLAVDDLVENTASKMGSLFAGLTDDFNESQKETFNKLISDNDSNSLQNPFVFSYST